MNSIPMTTATTALATAVATTMTYTGKIDRMDSIIATTTSTLTHYSNAAISNLTTNMVMTTSTNIASISKEFQTPNSIRKSRNGTYHAFPIVNTPTPPSRLRKIFNPFESHINERLHLPLIDSPSLFHRSTTPQLCSTQFEWTIDEMSSLNPANVEAHETQFASSEDPEVEAKAQAAISSFFKDRIIVPSPDDCPLRGQKIVLNKPTTRDNQQLAAARVTCDNSCQTELTLPPTLPKEVEDVLRPFFTYMQEQQITPIKDCDSSFNITMQNASVIDHDARNAILFRKLFPATINMSADHSAEYEREVHLDSPAPQTPEMQLSDMRSLRFMTTPRHNAVQDENEPPLDISLNASGREIFGHISPISKDDTATPLLRPKSQPSSRKKDDSSLYRSTPDHHSMMCKSIDMAGSDNAVNCSYMSQKRKSFHFNDERSSESIDTVNLSCDDEMQLSYGSHPQTPQINRSKRRCNSVNRKNLSRSFNQIEEHQQQQEYHQQRSALSIIRTDSGFNEPNECSSQHMSSQTYHEQNETNDDATFHDLTTMKSCDVSMASIN